MSCHDSHAQGACAAVFSGIRQPSPRSSPRARASRACLHPVHRAPSRFVPFRSLSFRSSFRRPACGGTLFRAYRARPRPPAFRGGVRFARPIAPARAGRAQGARFPSVPFGFFRAGAKQEAKRCPDAASSCPIIAWNYQDQAFLRIITEFFEPCTGSDPGPAVSYQWSSIGTDSDSAPAIGPVIFPLIPSSGASR